MDGIKESRESILKELMWIIIMIQKKNCRKLYVCQEQYRKDIFLVLQFRNGRLQLLQVSRG